MSWDKVVTSTPLDKVAGQVTSKGVEFKDKSGDMVTHWDDCPKINTLVRDKGRLKGKKFGTFTVIGILHEEERPKRISKKKIAAPWVVRCSCGRFTIRKSKAIKRAVSGANSYGHFAICGFCLKKHRYRTQGQYNK